MFSLQEISLRYGEALALDALSLDLGPAQTTALIGPSGCGKSSLLRLLLGLLRPSSGQVRFRGAPVTSESAPSLRRSMGYVIQGGGLFPHLTAEDNVALLPRHIGWDPQRIDARRQALGELTHIDPELWRRYPAQLSGGQAQRIALVRALMTDPEVLLLDEPLGALDPLVRAELQRELRSIFQDLGKTVVLVTHDLAEAAYLGDSLVLLRAGRIVQHGGLEDLRERPADPFVSEFLEAHRGLAL